MGINIPSNNIAALAAKITADTSRPGTPNTETAHASLYQGTAFQSPRTTAQKMHRGPTLRMPLSSPKQKAKARRGASNAKAADSENIENSQDDLDASTLSLEESRARLIANVDTREKGGDQSDDQHRHEKRAENLFEMTSARTSRGKPIDQLVIKNELLEQTGGFARNKSIERFTPSVHTELAKKFAPSPKGPPPVMSALDKQLPPMESTRDVLDVIHQSLQRDPSGHAALAIMKKVNVAVLRDELKLPLSGKIADVKNQLVEIFGKGHTSEATLPQAVRSLHALLPLRLINLNRSRTEEGKRTAVARLSLPMLRA